MTQGEDMEREHEHDQDIAALIKDRRKSVKRFGDCVAELGFASQEKVDQALAAAQARAGGSGGKIEKVGKILSGAGILTARQIAEVNALRHGIPFTEIGAQTAILRQALSEDLAKTYKAVCAGRTSAGRPRVVMADPSDGNSRLRIEEALGPCQFESGAEDEIEQAITRVYDTQDEIEGLADDLLTDILKDGPQDAGEIGRADSPIARFTDSLFEAALARRASDIHIEPRAGRLAIRFRVDGDLRYFLGEVDSALGPRLVQKVKLMANLDITKKNITQDGRFKIVVRGKSRDARIATSPVIHGEGAVIRLLASQADIKSLEDLGLHPDDHKSITEALRHPNGLILVTGPTGSGKTTTLYSALQRLNSPAVKIVTIEDPVEITLDGPYQHQVGKELTFETALKSFLRQDPDIILVGEMRDRETAVTGVTAAQTGHLVLSTLHTNDSVGAAQRMIDIGVDKSNLASTLRLVVAQRLMKTACPKCAEPVPITEADRVWLETALGRNDIPDFGPMRGTGKRPDGATCEHCDGSGWHGRAPIHECLVIDGALVRLLAHGSQREFEEAARAGLVGRTLAARAASLALSGMTTVDEARSVAGSIV